MSYSGTTAASSISNPPILLARGFGSGITTASSIGGQGLWIYTSSHSATEMSSGTNTGNFFTDGVKLGMKGGDVIFLVGNTGSSISIAVGVVGMSTDALGAFVSSGSQVSSTFN